MSSEVFILRVRGEKPVTPALWRAVWRIVWSRVEAMEPPSVHAFRAEYFEDLLPDQEAHLMDLTPDAEGQRLTFIFPDFGGHFSSTITLLVEWFSLLIGERYLQVHEAVHDAGLRIHAEELPRLDVTRPRAVIEHEGRLHLVHRGADDVVTLTPEVDNAEVLARARMLLDAGTTEDPIWKWAARVARGCAAERAEHELTWMKERMQALLASLSALSEPALLDAMLTRHHTPEAALWLDKQATPIARTAPEVLAKHLATDAKHAVLMLIERAYPSARAKDKDALAALAFTALHDPELASPALNVDLDDKHRDAAFFARVTELLPELSETLQWRAGVWALGALQRRWPKGETLPQLATLIVRWVDVGNTHFDEALQRVLDGRRWKGTGPLEEPVELALLARATARDREIPWLFKVMERRELPPELSERLLERVPEAGSQAAYWMASAFVDRVLARKVKRGKAPPPDARELPFERACIRVLAHRDPEVRAAALHALGRLREKHEERLFALLERAVEASGKDADSSALAALLERLYVLTCKHTDARVRALPVSIMAVSLSRGAGAVLRASFALWLAATLDPAEQRRGTMHLTWMLTEVATKESLALCRALAAHAFDTIPSADFLYQWACAHVREGALEEGAATLARAIALDPRQAEDARKDNDFIQHAAHPAFAKLLAH